MWHIHRKEQRDVAFDMEIGVWCVKKLLEAPGIGPGTVSMESSHTRGGGGVSICLCGSMSLFSPRLPRGEVVASDTEAGRNQIKTQYLD